MDDQPLSAEADENRFPVASFSPKGRPRPPWQTGLWVGGTIASFFLVFGVFWGSVFSGIADDFKPGYTHYQQGNYAAAETDFRKFTQGSWTANEGYGHYYLGLCLLHEGKMDEARTEIQFAVDHSGGGGHSGPDQSYYRAKRLLEVMKELPADPTTAQREQWIARHPKLFHPK
jgi:TolA-binding protein